MSPRKEQEPVPDPAVTVRAILSCGDRNVPQKHIQVMHITKLHGSDPI